MPLPKSSTMMLRHEPTLITTTGYQMTASSPRGTFSQAELTADGTVRNVSPAPNEREYAGQTGKSPMASS